MMTREVVRNLLLTQYKNYGFELLNVVTKYLLVVTYRGVLYHAVVLASSFEYYTRRYHLAGYPPDLVICYQHTTLLSVPVFALESGTWYDAATPPYGHEQYAKRSTMIGSQVLLGGLLIGSRAAQDLVQNDEFSRSTRYRYLRRLQQLQRRKRGRPVAS